MCLLFLSFFCMFLCEFLRIWGSQNGSQMEPQTDGTSIEIVVRFLMRFWICFWSFRRPKRSQKLPQDAKWCFQIYFTKVEHLDNHPKLGSPMTSSIISPSQELWSFTKWRMKNFKNNNIICQQQKGKQVFQSKKAHSFISRCLKNATPAPMVCLERDQPGANAKP